MRKALLSLLLLVPTVSPAQPERGRQPSFPVTTRLVEVSVIVHKDGAPVPGLTAQDFELLEDGQPQAIESLSVESDRAAGTAEALPAGSFSNRAAGRKGSVNVILLDRLNTSWSDQGQARDQVVKFLGQIQPEDRVALYLLDSSAVKVLHDFTRDTASLLRALARYRGQTSRELAVAEEPVLETGDAEMDEMLRGAMRVVSAEALRNRAEHTTSALEAIAHHLAGVPGRKNLIWVSSSFPFVIDDPAGRGGAAGLSPRSFREEVDRATRAVNDANVAIYPVDARGLMGAFVTPPAAMLSMPNTGRTNQGAPPQALFTTLETTMPGLDSMKTIAENTGGRAFYNSNDIGRAIRRAVEDARLSYVLGYAPSNDKWDGRFRELKVRVNRPGVEVRHRKGYLALPLPSQSSARTSRELSRALQSPLEATALPLVVTAQPTERRGELNLAIRVEGRSLTLERKGDAWEGGFALVVAQTSAEGKLFKAFDQNVDLKGVTDEVRGRLLQQGLVVNKKLELRDDAQRVHVLVRDLPTGTTGSLIIPAGRLREAARRQARRRRRRPAPAAA